MQAPLRHLFLLTIFLSIPAFPRTHSHSPKQEAPTDAGYVFALAAANHFLHAWQTGDLESGMLLLSNGLRHSQNADQMEDFFSNAKTKSRSYEITRGHGNPRPYTFPIVRVTRGGGDPPGTGRGKAPHHATSFPASLLRSR